MSNFDYAMSNLDDSSTGITGVVVYISQAVGRHLPRVKISNIPDRASGMKDSFSIVLKNDGSVSTVGIVKISAKQKSLAEKWVQLNRQTIIDYWHGNIDTLSMAVAIQRNKV